MTKFRFDPITQCSEVSLLKDLINPEQQLKFNKQHLNEVKIAFYNRGNNNATTNSSINKSLLNSSNSINGGKFNNQYGSQVEQNEDEPYVAEDIEDEEDDDEDEEDSQSDNYESEFAQSMPTVPHF